MFNFCLISSRFLLLFLFWIRFQSSLHSSAAFNVHNSTAESTRVEQVGWSQGPRPTLRRDRCISWPLSRAPPSVQRSPMYCNQHRSRHQAPDLPCHRWCRFIFMWLGPYESLVSLRNRGSSPFFCKGDRFFSEPFKIGLCSWNVMFTPVGLQVPANIPQVLALQSTKWQ
jgi:hypothetical protein